jgi:hypothetical protein
MDCEKKLNDVLVFVPETRGNVEFLIVSYEDLGPLRLILNNNYLYYSNQIVWIESYPLPRFPVCRYPLFNVMFSGLKPITGDGRDLRRKNLHRCRLRVEKRRCLGIVRGISHDSENRWSAFVPKIGKRYFKTKTKAEQWRASQKTVCICQRKLLRKGLLESKSPILHQVKNSNNVGRLNSGPSTSNLVLDFNSVDNELDNVVFDEVVHGFRCIQSNPETSTSNLIEDVSESLGRNNEL